MITLITTSRSWETAQACIMLKSGSCCWDTHVSSHPSASDYKGLEKSSSKELELGDFESVHIHDPDQRLSSLLAGLDKHEIGIV